MTLGGMLKEALFRKRRVYSSLNTRAMQSSLSADALRRGYITNLEDLKRLESFLGKWDWDKVQRGDAATSPKKEPKPPSLGGKVVKGGAYLGTGALLSEILRQMIAGEE